MIKVDLSGAAGFFDPAGPDYAAAAQAHRTLLEHSGAGAEFTGWLDLPGRMQNGELKQILAAASRIRGRAQALVVVGIGGSYLGAKGAVELLVHNIIALASLYDVSFEGAKVSSLAAGGYDVSVHFDDAIIQDRQTNINEGIMLVNNGLQSKYTFLTDTMGLTPEQAEAEIKRIKDEQAIGPEVIDKLDGFGA